MVVDGVLIVVLVITVTFSFIINSYPYPTPYLYLSLSVIRVMDKLSQTNRSGYELLYQLSFLCHFGCDRFGRRQRL